MNLFYDSNKENLASSGFQHHDIHATTNGVIMMNPNTMLSGNFLLMDASEQPSCKMEYLNVETSTMSNQQLMMNSGQPQFSPHSDLTGCELDDEIDESMPMSPASFGHNSSNFSDLSFNSQNMSCMLGTPNNHTFRKTEWDVKKLETHMKSYFGDTNAIENLAPAVLKSYIDHFLEYARKGDGMEYEPESLVGYMNSFERHLKTKNYPESILRSEMFADTRAHLKKKKELVKSIGRLIRIKSNDTPHLLKFYRNLFKERSLLNRDNPDCLLAEVYLNNMIYFGDFLKEDSAWRGNLNLAWGDIVLDVDPDNRIEYLTVSNRLLRQHNISGASNNKSTSASQQHLTQICQNSYDVKPRSNKIRSLGMLNSTDSMPMPRVYARLSSANECPVEAYKAFRQRRPSNCMDPESPFYLAPNNQRSKSASNGKAWYQSACMTCQRLDPLFYCLFKRSNVDLNSLTSVTNEQQQEMVAAAQAVSTRMNDFVIWKSKENDGIRASSLIPLPAANDGLVPTSIIESCVQQQVNTIIINGQAYPVMAQPLTDSIVASTANGSILPQQMLIASTEQIKQEPEKKKPFKMPIQIQVQIQVQVMSLAQREQLLQQQQQLHDHQQMQQFDQDTSLSLLP